MTEFSLLTQSLTRISNLLVILYFLEDKSIFQIFITLNNSKYCISCILLCETIIIFAATIYSHFSVQYITSYIVIFVPRIHRFVQIHFVEKEISMCLQFILSFLIFS